MKQLNTLDGAVEITEPDGFHLLPDNPYREVHLRLCSYLQETARTSHWNVKPKDYPSGAALLTAGSEVSISIMLATLEQLANSQCSWENCLRLTELLRPLLSRRLPYNEQALLRLLQLRATGSHMYLVPMISLLGNVDRYMQQKPLTPALREALKNLRDTLPLYAGHSERKARPKIDELLGNAVGNMPESGEPWADAAISDVGASAAWAAVFAHATTAEGGKPSTKWLAEVQRNRDAVGGGEFTGSIGAWLALTAPPPPLGMSAPKYPDADEMRGNRKIYDDYQQANSAYYAAVREYLKGISEKNITILKGPGLVLGGLRQSRTGAGAGAS